MPPLGEEKPLDRRLDVRRHDAVRDGGAGAARGARLRGARVPRRPAPGGRSMEELIEAGFITGVARRDDDGVLRRVVGGVLVAGPSGSRRRAAGHPAGRLARRARHGQLRPARHRAASGTATANLYVHNPTITLMRTTPEECARDRSDHRGQAERCHRADGAVRPVARRLGDRDRGPGLPRPGGRRGAVRGDPCATSIPRRSRCTRSTQTSTIRRSRSRWRTGCTS